MALRKWQQLFAYFVQALKMENMKIGHPHVAQMMMTMERTLIQREIVSVIFENHIALYFF